MTAPPKDVEQTPLHVVLFSGGRGSAALSRQLVASPAVDLTIVINGYDDGASTGEVRRFLGDSLGPSDFRKNAGNLAVLYCFVLFYIFFAGPGPWSVDALRSKKP